MEQTVPIAAVTQDGPQGPGPDFLAGEPAADPANPGADPGGLSHWNRAGNAAGFAAILRVVDAPPPPGLAAFRPAAGEVAVRRATATMFLSLVLIVLAFFIILVAISQPDGTREAMALGSVAETFAAPTIEGEVPKPAEADAGAFLNGAASFTTIEAEFATRLGIVVVERPAAGQVLHLAVPVERLFVSGTASLRLAIPALIDDVAGALAAADDWPAVTVLVSPSGGGDDRRGLAGARAGRLAEALIAAGVGREAVTAGIAPAGPATVRFRFDLDDDPPSATGAAPARAGRESDPDGGRKRGP